MKQVTKEDFYTFINPLDVCVSVENLYAKVYTTLFKYRNGNLVGKITPVINELGSYRYPIENEYFLNI